MSDAAGSQERIAALRRRWEEDHSSRVFLHLAEEYRRNGDLAEAVEVLEAGLATQPGYLSAQVALGRCRLDLGEHAAAAQLLQRVIQQDPTHLVATKLLVHARLGLEDPAAAADLLDRYALLNVSDPEVPELRARVQRLAAGRAAKEVDSLSDTASRRDRLTRDAAPSPAADEELDLDQRATASVPQRQSASAAGVELAASERPLATADVEEAARTAGASPADVFALPPPPRPALDLGGLRPPRRAPPPGLRDPFPQLRTVPPTAAAALFGDIFAAPPESTGPAELADTTPEPPGLPSPPSELAVSTAEPEPALPAFPYSEPGPIADSGAEPATAGPAAELAPAMTMAEEPVVLVEPAPAATFAGERISSPLEMVDEVEVLAPEASPASAEPADAALPAPTAAEPGWPTADFLPIEPAAPGAGAGRPVADDEPITDTDAVPPPAPPWPASAPAAPAWADAVAATADFVATPAAPAVASPSPLSLVPDAPLAVPTSAAPPVTATLGELYLRQGHLDEAEGIFRSVLDRQPEHLAARDGLAEIARRRVTPVAATDLLAGFRGPGGLTAKKTHILQRYLSRLRQGA